MIRNYFKVAIRNLIRHRNFTVVNLIGLTLGITCAMFIYLIASYEVSYDQYHRKADRIYRINTGSPGGEFDMGSPQGLAPVLRDEFTDFDEVATILKLNPERTQITINTELFRENQTFFVQPQFFHLFDFQWTKGSADTALDAPNKAAVSESIAKKYFDGAAIGKVFRLDNNEDFVVSGVFADPPVNTDFPVHIALSHATLEKDKEAFNPGHFERGTNSYYQTYVSINEGSDISRLPSAFRSMVEKYAGKEQAEKHLAFQAQPLSDIHFNIDNFNKRTISKSTIQALRVIGIFILVIACINFINLASAQSVKRSKETGIRKTLGSSRYDLIFQFLGETFVLTLAAVLLSWMLIGQLVSFSKNLTGIPLSPEVLTQPHTLLTMAGILAIVTLLSGFYPAFILSSYKPVSALKNNVTTGAKGLFFRKGLITFQFVISQILIVCTLLVIRQTHFFSTQPLGFNRESVLTADIPVSKAATLSSLKNNLLQHKEIRNVSYSLNTPSATINKYWANFKHGSFQDEMSTEVKFIDSTYLKMFEIEKVAGRLNIEGDSVLEIVVNETFVKSLGMQDPNEALGERIRFYETDATIVGVVKDFQTVTLREGMHPVLLAKFEAAFQKVSLKIEKGHEAEAIAHLEKHWKEAFPGYFFTYAFLDDQLSTFYKEEKKLSRLLIIFATVAVGISCIGLFGLISFAAVQRAKEIGIRKILGATISTLATLLSKDFIVLVVIAGCVALPIAYYSMDQWLKTFSNHIQLTDNVWVFAVGAGLAVLFALVTTSIQSVKAALTNPVDSLRNE
jgi:ABC-type antimicrobial peptide transport system permease subunit